LANPEIDLSRISEDLADPEASTVDRAVEGLRAQLPVMGEADYRRAIEALCSLFYVDTADRPDLEGPIERATALLAEQGERVVPLLLTQMQGSDIKSHIFLARTLGRMGIPALAPLRDLLATAEDAYSRAFALYALGKMTCPEVVRALPDVLGGLMHPDKEVRDTAARTIGKIAQSSPPGEITPRRRAEMFEALMRASRDAQAPVRAKAMRSLGKMARAGLLDGDQRNTVAGAARAALGKSETFEWDQAFIVRREAHETLGAVESRD
jgi:HEAT repeat protein